MKVSELPYKRVTIEEIKAVMDDVLARTRNAKSVDEILAARDGVVASVAVAKGATVNSGDVMLTLN